MLTWLKRKSSIAGILMAIVVGLGVYQSSGSLITATIATLIPIASMLGYQGGKK